MNPTLRLLPCLAAKHPPACRLMCGYHSIRGRWHAHRSCNDFLPPFDRDLRLELRFAQRSRCVPRPASQRTSGHAVKMPLKPQPNCQRSSGVPPTCQIDRGQIPRTSAHRKEPVPGRSDPPNIGWLIAKNSILAIAISIVKGQNHPPPSFSRLASPGAGGWQYRDD
jgi:hypothetical protein